MNSGYPSSGRMGFALPQYYQQAGEMGFQAQGMGTAQQQPVLNQVQPSAVNIVNSKENKNYRSAPISITCKYCSNPVITKVEKSCNYCAFFSCIISLVIFYYFIQCCRGKDCGCSDAVHKCPSCGQKLGNYKAC